ncbi:MAG: PEGA domain-containing protein [Spirochaetaceae bacterium]|jgi:hypothetical protein|nr:PEGA domain-containing protein [Spirochaetaceae bacterium]
MKQKVIFSFLTMFIFCFASVALHAKGKVEEIQYQNTDWTLCLTRFDVSAMPQSRQVLGETIIQNIVVNLLPAELKFRTPDEYAYYLNAADLGAQKSAAEKISSKQAERDKLLYQGLSEIQYKTNLKKIDAELEALRKTYNETVLIPPKVDIEPKFIVNSTVTNFPDAPKPGSEYFFCKAQKADGFITGKITEYYERVYVQIALWTLYAGAYIFTDSVIFSVSDLEKAVTELSDRLVDVITGMRSAGIRIKAVPEEAVIIIGSIYGGKGEAEILNFTPGDVDISVYAENYRTTNATITLNEDEFADINVELVAVPSSKYTIDVEGGESAAVYEGSLYKGETPLELQGSTDTYRQYNVITPDGKTDQTIFKVDEKALIMIPKPQPEEGRTNKARHWYYNAMGRFWLTLPFAVLGYGLYNTYYVDAVRFQSYKMAEQTQTIQYVSIGFAALAGIFLVESFVHLGMYIWEANKDISPITGKKKPEDIGKEIKPLSGGTAETGAAPETESIPVPETDLDTDTGETDD